MSTQPNKRRKHRSWLISMSSLLVLSFFILPLSSLALEPIIDYGEDGTLAPTTKGTAPTLIRLESFQAYSEGDAVRLQWSTGYELNNLGFHLYREENGELYRITPELIVGSALMVGFGRPLAAGRTYRWFDVVVPGLEPLSLRYWLEEVGLNGRRFRHGPVQPDLSNVNTKTSVQKERSQFLNEIGKRLNDKYEEYRKIQNLREKLRQKAPGSLERLLPNDTKSHQEAGGMISPSTETLAASEPLKKERKTESSLASWPAIKLLIKEEGWYRVTQPELLAAGLDPEVDPRNLQLYVDGQEIPIRVTGEKDKQFDLEDTIEFYGIGLDTLSTDKQVYWLVDGSKKGKRIKNVRGKGAASNSTSFSFTVERKDRVMYFAGLKNGDESNIFGPLIAEYPIAEGPVEQILTVLNPDFGSSKNATLEVSIQGASEELHRISVLFNDTAIGEMAFSNQELKKATFNIPHSWLLKGNNLVTLIAQGGEADVSVLDFVRLTYRHTFVADDNALKFTAQGGKSMTVRDFRTEDIQIIDITDPDAVLNVTGTVNAEDSGYSITFKVPKSERRTLLAFTEEKIKSPAEISANQPSSWSQFKDGCDLVIVAHGDFLENLNSLKTLRESQGLSVALIDVEDLYDEFNFGVKSPRVLKDFIEHARKHWKKPPRFVLLVGDASLDPRNYLGYGDFDFVPTKLIDTTFIETSSDDWFVDSNNDGLPEMAIGRLPVRTSKETATIVSKIVGYEDATMLNQALLVADKVEPGDLDFEAASLEVEAALPAGLDKNELFRGEFTDKVEFKNELLGAINMGPLLVNYLGDGSIEAWTKDTLTVYDAANLTNGPNLPFFIAMTTLNGAFHDVYTEESLAEALLKAENGGAIAIWTSSASGFPDPSGQVSMNKEMIRLLFGEDDLTLGKAAMRAKAATTEQDIRRTWMLFGDPSTKLKY